MGLQRVKHNWVTLISHTHEGFSLVAQLVKNPPAMWETWVQSLGWEDPLEKGTATHSSILAWRISWIEEPGGLQSMGSQRVRHDWATSLFTFICHEVHHFVQFSECSQSCTVSRANSRTLPVSGTLKDRVSRFSSTFFSNRYLLEFLFYQKTMPFFSWLM